ncbi:hypothetical protein KM043_003614 [Ampulex compressa]|nr:hypothetical protein KM043_003614 [Ampulex compressa]
MVYLMALFAEWLEWMARLLPEGRPSLGREVSPCEGITEELSSQIARNIPIGVTEDDKRGFGGRPGSNLLRVARSSGGTKVTRWRANEEIFPRTKVTKAQSQTGNFGEQKSPRGRKSIWKFCMEKARVEKRQGG